MAVSSKAVVFEAGIPFQLAFYALIEHGSLLFFGNSLFPACEFLTDFLLPLPSHFNINLATDVAPIWDAEKHVFVALMTIGDYIRALLVCHTQNISMLDLSTRSIADMLCSPLVTYQHNDFHALDADDSVQQLCLQLTRLSADYVPIVDPDAGSLVSVLGHLDVVHLLDQAAKQHPNLFFETLEQMRIGTYGDRVVTAPYTAMLPEVIATLAQHNLSGIPIVDHDHRVVGLYHKTDVTFITKAADPDAVLTNLAAFSVSDVLQIQQQQAMAGEDRGSAQVLITCLISDRIDVVLAAMMNARTTRIVCIDGVGRCLGIISVKDIVHYYLG
jgi:CBS domain-containing protein